LKSLSKDGFDLSRLSDGRGSVATSNEAAQRIFYVAWHASLSQFAASPMATLIATRQTFELAADVVSQIWQLHEMPILRLEGFDGVGKSGIAKLVADRIDAAHVEGDKFAFRPDEPTAYQKCLRLIELEEATSKAVASGKPVILDAVCSRQVWPTTQWGQGLVVYVKRLSFNNFTPIWHHGLSLEEVDAPSREPHLSIFEYHVRFAPHKTADLIIELPDQGHTIRSTSFERDMCFDPSDSELLESAIPSR
jgi:hypothetical protein